MPSSIFFEAEIISQLRHPGIPILYDIEEDETYLYLIEEYIQGESLEEILLQKDSVSQEYIMQIGIQICEILTFLHTHKPFPILHQDLKPSHIIVCGNQVKIIDFGIASYITNQGKNYHKYGTKGFAAPEQYESGPPMVQSDIYELGAVLALYMKEQNRTCSKEFRFIIRKATEKNPKKRYASAHEMQQDLQKALRKDDVPEGSLLKTISVVGACPGAGSTHLAIAVTSFWNQVGSDCIYIQQSKDCVLENILRHEKSVTISDGNIRYQNFWGREDTKEQEGACRVYDFGCDRTEAVLEEADITILVVNLSVWRWEAAWKAYEELKNMPNLKVVCNLSTSSAAKKFAAQIGQNVYYYPTDTAVFRASREKSALFTQMFCKKGEE